MTQADFIFATITPLLAIALQRWSFPNDAYLEGKANAYAEELRPPHPTTGAAQTEGPAEAARGIISLSSKGAVAMASVAPTLVSSVVSAFALVNGRSDTWVYMLIIFLVGALGAIWGISKMHAFGPLEIASYGIKFRVGQRTFTRADVIAWITYVINAALIVLAMLIYWGVLPLIKIGG